MARAGSLHVTVIAATLLRDSGGSDSDPADTYASVGCGNQNFTTNTVKNHRTKPSWNESHTFRFEERNELESQHILIEIFAERPKLDELLGLAKIPLHKVIAAGDEISTHSLNRPDEEYIGQEQYSGHVKVALRWDSVQVPSVPVYPQTYTPAARYNPNASTANDASLSRQTSRSGEQLQTRNSAEDLHHIDDYYEHERRVHHRSSSYPSRSYDTYSSAQHPLNVNPPGPYPTGPSRHLSVGAGSNGSLEYQNGHATNPHIPYSGPHVPYVPHEGNRPVNGTFVHHVHMAYQKPVESVPTNLDSKQQDELAKLKLSKAKQVEMAKLAELSRLTETAKIQATGFAKAGQQATTRPKQSVRVNQHQSQASMKSKDCDVVLQQPNQGPPSQNGDISQQNQSSHGTKKDEVRPQQQLTNTPHRPQSKGESQQLTVVSTMLDIVPVQCPQKPQRDENPQSQAKASQRTADVFYEKAIQKAEKPDKKKGSPLQQILRKASKMFRT